MLYFAIQSCVGNAQGLPVKLGVKRYIKDYPDGFSIQPSLSHFAVRSFMPKH